MIWAYILENQGVEDFRSNKPVFLLMTKLNISDDYIVFDSDTSRPEFDKLLVGLNAGDSLLVRSVEDIADTIGDLTDILQLLADRRVTLCSCEEPFLSGDNYFDTLFGCYRLFAVFQKKRQRSAYDKAYNAGKVGRPQKTKSIEKAVTMYQTGAYKVNQITAITGVSKTTLYRYLDK